MKKIFLDCGAHCGCSYRKFKKEFDTNNEYDVFSFEPNPHLQKYYKSINRAVWIDNNLNTFYLKGPTSGGSTLIKEKTQRELDIQKEMQRKFGRSKKIVFEEVNIQCIDLNEFIKTSFHINDYIILKMDIEGAEYKVIPHLIKNNSIQYINKLWIEWHNKKVSVDIEVDNQLTKELQSMGIEVKYWDAMKYCKL